MKATLDLLEIIITFMSSGLAFILLMILGIKCWEWYDKKIHIKDD